MGDLTLGWEEGDVVCIQVGLFRVKTVVFKGLGCLMIIVLVWTLKWKELTC